MFFAQTVLTHPFSDGNGRFARLMVHAALARCAGLGGPTIALAPAFYRNAESLGAALTRVSDRGDWSALYRVFFSTFAEALAQTRELQRVRVAR
jgi:Fic family protein